MRQEENSSGRRCAKSPLGASPEAIRYHYDVGNDFYRLWLDSSMTYSAGIWEKKEDTLEDAQQRKRLHHIRASRAAGRERVLDIGCGWGSLLADLVTTHGVGKAVGLTLSPAQRDWIANLNLQAVETRLEGWQDHSPVKTYDAIISVGAFEHFVRPEYGSDQRRSIYREFFQKCHDMLRPDGWLSLQTQAYLLGEFSHLSPLTAVFPESDMPRLGEIVDAFDRLFELESLHNRPADYLATLKSWLARFSANKDAIISAVGMSVFQRYSRFLSGGIRGYSSSDVFMLLRMSLRRI